MNTPLCYPHAIEIIRKTVLAHLDVSSGAFHRICFATACLPISENCSMIPLKLNMIENADLHQQLC